VGEVIFVDRFGNCITNIHRSLAGSRSIDRVVVQPGLDAALCSHYAELAGGGRIGALWNSDGQLELAAFGHSAAEQAGLKPGDPVRLLFRPG
jgi:S-adenosylmethionine hydrolase